MPEFKTALLTDFKSPQQIQNHYLHPPSASTGHTHQNHSQAMPPTSHGLSAANTCCRRTPTTPSCPTHLRADVNRVPPSPRPKYVERAILRSMKEQAKPTFVQSRVMDGPGEGTSIAASQFVVQRERQQNTVRSRSDICLTI